MRNLARFTFVLLIAAMAFLSGAAFAADRDGEILPGGLIEAQGPDGPISFPRLKSDYDVKIRGDLVEVRLTQTFENPAKTPVNASYLFPLATEAAVYEMIMECGDERVLARIKKIEEARAEFEEAKSEGKAAALLEEQRPNMFTQKLANLMPGRPIKVTLAYVQAAPRLDGAYELALPLVVGPRYQPAGRGQAPADEGGRPEAKKTGGTPGRWELEELPKYPAVIGLNLPKSIEEERVSIAVDLVSPVPVMDVKSATHEISEDETGARHRRLSLAKGRVVDNRDFVLKWRLAGDSPQAGLLAHKDERGGFFSLLIEPPALPSQDDILPRELVFVLDTSGSMDGLPLMASRAFMRAALKTLDARDHFRILSFNNGVGALSPDALPATPENLAAALNYVEGLRANGGTEMENAIHYAFSSPSPKGSVRQVVFLTDGYIGDEASVIQTVGELIGGARLSTIGAGTSVNRYLLEEMGRVGRGWSRIIDPGEDVEEIGRSLAAQLDSPILTDISIDWNGLAGSELSEAALPDLFAGHSLRLSGRYEKGGHYTIIINAKANGRQARLTVEADLPDAPASDGGQAIALIWAKGRVAHFLRLMNTPSHLRDPIISDGELKARIVDLGLTYKLLTPWTSFVAVSEKIVNEKPAEAADADVPLPMPEGVTEKAYGEEIQTAFSAFTGTGTPEPGVWAGLLVVTGLAYFLRRRAFA